MYAQMFVQHGAHSIHYNYLLLNVILFMSEKYVHDPEGYAVDLYHNISLFFESLECHL
jgi:hypothetical protein